MASAVPDRAPAPAPSSRALPPDPVPVVPFGHQVILFLHGHSSSADEALDFIPHLLRAGRDRGVNFTVVALDLPNNGYGESFDHARIPGETRYPGGIFDRGPIVTPILDYIEDFVVAFVDALDAVTPVKDRFAGVIGGSLGGNLGLRLGQRDPASAPWLGAGIVSWSPASVWDPMVQDEIKRKGPDRCRDRALEPEDAGRRAAYFSEVYDTNLDPVFMTYTQPDAWYAPNWVCKPAAIVASRAARQEIYDANFRRWHWRVAGEQLVFSHVDRVVHDDAGTPWRYERNTVRQLLAAGKWDNLQGSNIFDASRTLANLMANTPGESLFLNDVGHSIHFERPRFFARRIVDFLYTGPSPAPPRATDVSYLVPLLLDD